MILISILVGAVAFRLRGSDLVHVTPIPMEGRVIWSVAMAALAFWLAGWDERMLILAPAFFLGAVPGWKSTIDLGRVEGSRFRDALVMVVRGLVWTLPAGAVLWFFGPPASWTFGLAGLLCPLLYEIGWRVPLRIPHLRQGPELGELLFGAWLGATLALSVHHHHIGSPSLT